jgi:hypothetical protein
MLKASYTASAMYRLDKIIADPGILVATLFWI